MRVLILFLLSLSTTFAACPPQVDTVRSFIHKSGQWWYGFTCNPPTARTDGTPLAAGDISHYEWWGYGLGGPVRLYTTPTCVIPQYGVLQERTYTVEVWAKTVLKPTRCSGTNCKSADSNHSILQIEKR